MLVAIQKGHGASYCALFCGKGPLQESWTVSWVVGGKLIDKSIGVTTAAVARHVRTARHLRDVDNAGYTVEIMKTAGATMNV